MSDQIFNKTADTHIDVRDSGQVKETNIPYLDLGNDLSVTKNSDGSVTVDSTGAASAAWDLEVDDSNVASDVQTLDVYANAGDGINLSGSGTNGGESRVGVSVVTSDLDYTNLSNTPSGGNEITYDSGNNEFDLNDPTNIEHLNLTGTTPVLDMDGGAVIQWGSAGDLELTSDDDTGKHQITHSQLDADGVAEFVTGDARLEGDGSTTTLNMGTAGDYPQEIQMDNGSSVLEANSSTKLVINRSAWQTLDLEADGNIELDAAGDIDAQSNEVINAADATASQSLVTLSQLNSVGRIDLEVDDTNVASDREVLDFQASSNRVSITHGSGSASDESNESRLIFDVNEGNINHDNLSSVDSGDHHTGGNQLSLSGGTMDLADPLSVDEIGDAGSGSLTISTGSTVDLSTNSVDLNLNSASIIDWGSQGQAALTNDADTGAWEISLDNDDTDGFARIVSDRISVDVFEVRAATNFDFSSNKLTNLADGTANQDAATYSQLNDGSVDHGNLSGLADDDHTQYLLVDGTRAMSGSLQMASTGTNAITDVTDPTNAQDAATRNFIANAGGTLLSWDATNADFDVQESNISHDGIDQTTVSSGDHHTGGNQLSLSSGTMDLADPLSVDEIGDAGSGSLTLSTGATLDLSTNGVSANLASGSNIDWGSQGRLELTSDTDTGYHEITHTQLDADGTARFVTDELTTTRANIDQLHSNANTNISVNSHKLTDVTDGTNNQDAATVSQLNDGTVDHDNLSGVSTSDHHIRPSAGSGLSETSNAFDINAGNALNINTDTLDVDESAISHDNISGVSTSDHHVRPSAGNQITDNSNTFDLDDPCSIEELVVEDTAANASSAPKITWGANAEFFLDTDGTTNHVVNYRENGSGTSTIFQADTLEFRTSALSGSNGRLDIDTDTTSLHELNHNHGGTGNAQLDSDIFIARSRAETDTIQGQSGSTISVLDSSGSDAAQIDSFEGKFDNKTITPTIQPSSGNAISIEGSSGGGSDVSGPNTIASNAGPTIDLSTAGEGQIENSSGSRIHWLASNLPYATGYWTVDSANGALSANKEENIASVSYDSTGTYSINFPTGVASTGWMALVSAEGKSPNHETIWYEDVDSDTIIVGAWDDSNSSTDLNAFSIIALPY